MQTHHAIQNDFAGGAGHTFLEPAALNTASRSGSFPMALLLSS